MDDAAYLHALCSLRPRITALRLRALLTAAGSAAAAWNADTVLLQRAGWSEEASAFFDRQRQRFHVEGEAERLAEGGITLVPLLPENDAYPPLLRALYDPPVALYVRGNLRSAGPSVAVVGSRTATPYGRTATHTIVKSLAAKGITIVSGLAYGIDAEAHRATLAVHGHTVAVLGSGVDEPSLYPRAHRGLAAEIVARGGAVISEFPPGTGARAEFFPQRNRIIAGLSKAAVIVEAGRESGALITARLALAENREVFAVPGPITSPLSEGTNRLLREGAAVATSADDILESLALEEVLTIPVAASVEAAVHEAPKPVSGEATAGVSPAAVPSHRQGEAVSVEDRLLGVLSHEPQHIDAIAEACILPPHEVAATLSLLELAGHVRDVGGKNYVRL